MERFNFKKYVFKISLILILLISVFLCIYSVKNYKSNNTITQNNQFKGEGKQFNHDVNNIPNNQKQPENIPSSDETVQPDQNGGMSPNSGNKQPGQNGNMVTANGGMQRENANNKYISALTSYSSIFLILCILSYYLFR